jgi:tripartite ATP-independent transporter DctM subunit
VIVSVVLILAVLGSIYRGICTPTEASGIGAVGALVAAALHRRLTWKNVSEALDRTLRLTGMVFWLLIAATYFSNLFAALGAQKLIMGITGVFKGSPWAVIVLMQMSLLVLGMFMDDFAIIVLVTPIYVPIIRQLGFDPLWFGILFIINMNISYLTPPYGFDLFYLKGLTSTKGVIPENQPSVTMGEIYKAVLPFIICQIICLVLVMVFPSLATWLPSTMERLK